jgi:hypothetical protein
VGQSLQQQNILIKEEEPANLQSTSKEGGKRTPNQQLGREGANRKDYTSEKEKNREERSWRGAVEPQAKFKKRSLS